MRGLMVNTVGEDYMLLAEAKGLPKRRILWRYAVRNAIPPQLTHLAIALGYVVSGAILVEIVFPTRAWLPALHGDRQQRLHGHSGHHPHPGRSVGFAVLIIDLIYPRLDPRVTYVARVRAHENSNVTRNYVVQRQDRPGGAVRKVIASSRITALSRLGFCFCLRSTCSIHRIAAD